MAATKEKSKVLVNSILVPFGHVHWDRSLNAREDYGDDKELAELRASIAERNWDFDYTVNVQPIPDEEKELAVASREKDWAELKSRAGSSADLLVVLDVWEQLYTDGKKVIVPEYLGITGNRRSVVFLDAMVDRRRQNQDIDPNVSVRVRHPESEAERLAIVIEENLRATTGRLKMSDRELVKAAKRMFDLGKNQSFIRRTFTDTTGQKLYSLCVLDHRYPGLELVKRLTLPAGDPRHLPYGPIKGAELPAKVSATDPEVLKEKNRKLAAEGKPLLEPVSEEALRDYFFAPKTDSGNKPKIMKRDDIETLSKQSPNEVVKRATAAIMADDSDGLIELVDWAPAINAVVQMAEDGDYPLVESLLLALKKIPTGNRKAMVDAACDVFTGHTNV